MNSILQQRLLTAFAQHFGTSPSLWVRAPGRVNLIGEHTDNNDGFVLPCAIDKGTLVAVQARDDAVVRVCATDCEGTVDEFRIDATITANPQAPWANYVRGVLEVLRQRGLALLRTRGAGLEAEVQRLGRLMAQSHASLRDDFEITAPATDQLVQLLQDAIGSAGGARMTGGGFGGCVVALMPSHCVDAARTAVQRRYRSPRLTPVQCSVPACENC